MTCIIPLTKVFFQQLMLANFPNDLYGLSTTRREHLTVNYTETQSSITLLSHVKLWVLLLNFDWFVSN